MTGKLIFILILVSTSVSCYSQTNEEKEKLDREILIGLREWFKNPTVENKVLNPEIIKELSDSGRKENGIKTGTWIEFSLDSSISNSDSILIVIDKKLPYSIPAKIQKETGEYLNGKKEGVWVLFDTYDKKPPFYWRKFIETSYKKGLKEGEEIIYQGFGLQSQKPVLIKHYKGNIENGIGKIYDYNHPYNLLQKYISVNGKTTWLEQYFRKGGIQYKLVDTLIKTDTLKFVEEFYENGFLKSSYFQNKKETATGTSTTYYPNGKIESLANYNFGKLDGTCKYFFDTGQLWTERIYIDGKLWNILSNFNKQGKKKNPGTIKDGNGTMNVYDLNGNLTETAEYINGIEKIK